MTLTFESRAFNDAYHIIKIGREAFSFWISEGVTIRCLCPWSEFFTLLKKLDDAD